MVNFIEEAIDKNDLTASAVYEQLAEECNELAQAALKMARSIRKENPTPVSSEEAERMLNEEFTDVLLVANSIGLSVDQDTYRYKLNRWKQRLKTKTGVSQ